ncbi:MAG: polysaccharide deacetylase family protein [Candidatus Zixiibacteriota bacterium]
MIILKKIDQIISNLNLKLLGDKPGLRTFLFHNFYHKNNPEALEYIDPQPAVSIETLERFIDFLLEKDYQFVTPSDIISGLDEKKYVLLTYDDGYFNNVLTLPILRKFDVPATIFTSSDHIIEQKSFWWDSLARQNAQKLDLSLLKRYTNSKIEESVIKEYGLKALQPQTDYDRPFTKSELIDFLEEPLINAGNHTANHAILTNYNSDSIEEEISKCQNFLKEITGENPIIISYPNGNFNDEIVDISKSLGLKLGITTIQMNNKLPIDSKSNQILKLNRFAYDPRLDFTRQVNSFRSTLHIRALVKKKIKEVI